MSQHSPIIEPPAIRLKRTLTRGVLLILGITGLCAYLEVDPGILIRDFPYVLQLAGDMSPPNLAILWTRDQILYSILQTVAMAFLATFIGGILSIVLAFLAAENTTPHPLIRPLVRATLAIERVIPSLVIILVFLIAVGLGPFAGMLALTVGMLGTFGKLFADALEQAAAGPQEAIYSVGARRMQVIRFGVLPQVLPSFIGRLCYAFDVNLRAAIGLGVFGGGGLGFELHLAMKVMRYRDALALILITVVLITLLEKLSDYLRGKVMGREVLK